MKFKSFLSFFIIKFILFLQLILFIHSIIDEIIRLGDDSFRYITFATNLKGDMIIITSSSSSSSDLCKERRLFGLKKNGRFFFEDDNNNETPFISLYANTEKPKLQSESSFLFLSNGQIDENNGNQYLFSLSTGDSTVEIYNLIKPYSISDNLSIFYYSRSIRSLISSFFKSSYTVDSKYYYIHAHTIKSATDIPFYIFRDFFDSPTITSKS